MPRKFTTAQKAFREALRLTQLETARTAETQARTAETQASGDDDNQWLADSFPPMGKLADDNALFNSSIKNMKIQLRDLVDANLRTLATGRIRSDIIDEQDITRFKRSFSKFIANMSEDVLTTSRAQVGNLASIIATQAGLSWIGGAILNFAHVNLMDAFIDAQITPGASRA